jgi:xylose dehydrogenase (NAD/NADP)
MARKVRWGILGTAGIGIGRFIPGAQKGPHCEVLAIGSRDPGRARIVAARLGIPRAYGSYEEVLADEDIEAVYIPLPPSLHAEWAIKSAEAGKAVLVEKPFCADAAEAEAMIQAGKKANVPLMEAFMYRFHPQHAHVRTLIDGGAIGDLVSVQTAFSFQLDPLDPQNIRLRPDAAGGALTDIVCYPIHGARMLFGVEPVAVMATQDFRPEFGVDLTTCGVMEFPGKRFALFEGGFRGISQGGWYRVVGSAGNIEVPFAYGLYEAEALIILNDASGRHEQRIGGVNQYTMEAEEIAACLIEGRAPRYPAEDALANMRAMDAIRRSAEADGRRQTI